MSLETFTISCAAALRGAEDALPDSIQYMPPGVHYIRPLGWEGEEPMRTAIDAEYATRMVGAFHKLKEEVSAGLAKDPMIDFNHEGGRASGWIDDLYWAGDDPVKGGIRARVRWSDSGKSAVKGMDYRFFSPSFLSSPDGSILALESNMGGLVNDPAFRSIRPIAAHRQPIKSNPNQKNMDTLISKLKAAGLVSDKTTAETIETELDSGLDRIKAERDAAKAELTELRASHDALADERAEELTRQAVESGMIPPKNDALKASFKAMVKAGGGRNELMSELIRYRAAQSGTGVPARVLSSQSRDSSGGASEFISIVNARQHEGKTSRAQAILAAVKANPSGHREWLAAGCPGL